MIVYIIRAKIFRGLVVRNCDSHAVKAGPDGVEADLDIDDALERFVAVDLIFVIVRERSSAVTQNNNPELSFEDILEHESVQLTLAVPIVYLENL